MSKDDFYNNNDESQINDEFDIDEEYFDEDIGDYDDWEEDGESMQRIFPRWIIVSVALLVLISFIALISPNMRLLFTERFDFLSQNVDLEKDPLVLNARESVVSLTALGVDDIPAKSRAGTGFVISENGEILTNLHVVDGAKQIKVEFKNGDVYYSQDYKPLADRDAALIKISADSLPFIQLAGDILPAVNEFVTIVGNPLGFKWIAVRGKISRYLNLNDSGLVLEIDLDTRPGSSGSPVINDKGQAVAIVYAIYELKEENQKPKTATLAIPLHLIKDDL